MARTQGKDITKVEPSPAALARPSFMDGAPDGMDQVKQYVSPPRIKIIQKQAGEDVLAKFGVGDVVLMPAGIVLAEMGRTEKGQPTGEGQSFLFTPLFFYAEWCTWNPLQMKGTLPAIRERSLDPKSKLAAKARDKNLRREACPEKPELQLRHVEHLNFIVVVRDGPMAGEPVVMSFSRGEHVSGQRFASLLRMRKAPIYGCVFEAHCAARSNNNGDWWGLDIINPGEPVSGWVAEAEFEGLKKLHLELKEKYEQGLIRADYEDDGPTSGESEVDPAKTGF